MIELTGVARSFPTASEPVHALRVSRLGQREEPQAVGLVADETTGLVIDAEARDRYLSRSQREHEVTPCTIRRR